MASREELLADTFVVLADTLVQDFDPVDALTVLAERCVALLDVSLARILVEDTRRRLQLVAESSEPAYSFDLNRLSPTEGPGFDAYRRGETVRHTDLVRSPWPRFGPLVAAAGLRSVHALPLRMRDSVIGAMCLFKRRAGRLPDRDATIADALAHAATITLLQHQSHRRYHELTAQLQGALNSRVAIEQAKGALAEHAGIGLDEAFERLRTFARDRNVKLTDLAIAFVNRSLPAETVSHLTNVATHRRV